MKRPLRLLTIGHPYALSMSRRLPNEMAKAGGSNWEVLAVGPSFYQGGHRYADLAPSHLIVDPGETARVAGMPMFFNHNPHLAVWGNATRRLLREPFDIVHCWDEPFNPLCAQVAAFIQPSAAFTFYTFQNISKRYPPPFNVLEKFSLNRSSGWIAAGSLVEHALSSRPGYRERPHRILGLGVDIEQFSPNPTVRRSMREELGWADDTGGPIVGFVGRFTEAKGIKILLRTLDRVDHPWRALFVGSGDLEGEIDQWARRYPGRVLIKRNVEHGQVADHLNACDILCAPSQTTPIWREQFGRMLVEAFACGVAVVTSDSGEIPFVVGDAAVVVPERDDAAWYEAINRFICDPSSRAGYRTRGLSRVREKFSWGVLAMQHLEFFEQLIACKSIRQH